MNSKEAMKAKVNNIFDEAFNKFENKNKAVFHVLAESFEKLMNDEISVREANAISRKAGEIQKQLQKEFLNSIKEHKGETIEFNNIED